MFVFSFKGYKTNATSGCFKASKGHKSSGIMSYSVLSIVQLDSPFTTGNSLQDRSGKDSLLFSMIALAAEVVSPDSESISAWSLNMRAAASTPLLKP